MNEKLIKNSHNVAFIGIRKNLENGQVAFNIRGTGIVFKDKKLITCAHVFNEIPPEFQKTIFCGISMPTDEKIKTYNSHNINLIDKDDTRDIALFDIMDEKNELDTYGVTEDLFMNKEEIDKLNITESVYFAGFPLANEFLNMNMGITMLASKCIIGTKKYSNIDKNIDFLMLDKQINPGNSGSPVFYGQKIIGLASGNINQTHKIGENLVNVPVGVGIVRTSNYILDLLSKQTG